jgi:hypothetical protein
MIHRRTFLSALTLGTLAALLTAGAQPQSGDKAKARHYFARLVEVAGQGSTRPELAQARAFLAANP